MNKHVKTAIIIAVLGVFAILALQALWLSVSYRLEQKKLIQKATPLAENVISQNILVNSRKWWHSIQKQYGHDIVPYKGGISHDDSMAVIKVYNPTTKSYTSYEKKCKDGEDFIKVTTQILYHACGLDIDMLKLSLDDVFPNNAIFIPYIIEKIDTETGQVVRRIDNREIPYRRFTTVCDTLRLGITGSDGILIKFDGSYTGMFAQIRLIILSSFVITLLVAVILFGILRIIFSQQKLSEFRESFVGHMIHEIRNPITYLKRVLELSPQIGPQAQVAAAYRKINDLNMVIEKLLSTTSNRLHIQKQNVDVAQLLETVCSTYPGASITTEIAPGITTLRADPFHYHNALRNLVDNAIKYSPDEKRISVRCYLENDRICMAVRDHGIGIPVSFQFMVFDRYFQVPRRKSVDVSGFGLGLSYVRQVAAAHGGEVHLTSVYHQGSIFTLEIPYDTE